MAGNPSLTVDDRLAPGTDLEGCCSCYSAVVAGVPSHAILLPIPEQQALLDKLQGHWKIKAVDPGDDSTVVYTDVFVEGNAYTISGGQTATEEGNATPTQKYYFKFYRAGETLYSDRFGSRVISLDFAEFKFCSPVNGGTRALWYREGAAAALKSDTVDEMAKRC
jgi:hypothetical protein